MLLLKVGNFLFYLKTGKPQLKTKKKKSSYKEGAIREEFHKNRVDK